MPENIIISLGWESLGFDRGLATTNKGMADLAKHVREDAAGALSTFGVNLMALNNPMTALASGLKSSIDFTTQWGDTIDEITRITGTSARESSKLAIVLNDVGISTESLKGAAKALRSQGLVPNLETLKDLAEQYQAIQDPAERNDFLFKKLGRSGLELSEFLSRDVEELDALSAAAERSGKIIDEAGIQKAEQYKQKLAQLGDQVDGVKLSVGSFAVDMLDKAVPAGQQYIGIYQALALKVELATGMIDQNTATVKAAEIAGLSHAEAIEQVYGASYNDLGIRIAHATVAQVENKAAIDAAIPPAFDLAGAVASIAGEQAKLADIQSGWASSTAQDVIRALTDAGVEGREYEAALIGIDTIMGTSVAAEDAQQKALDAISKAYADGTIDVDTFKLKLAILYSDDIPKANEAFHTAAGTTRDYLDLLNAIPAKVSTEVHTEYTYGGYAPGTVHGYQHGGSFIVPGSGSGDRPFMLNLEPGERVTVTPKSIVNNNGGNTYNYQGLQADMQAAYTRSLAGAF